MSVIELELEPKTVLAIIEITADILAEGDSVLESIITKYIHCNLKLLERFISEFAEYALHSYLDKDHQYNFNVNLSGKDWNEVYTKYNKNIL